MPERSRKENVISGMRKGASDEVSIASLQSNIMALQAQITLLSKSKAPVEEVTQSITQQVKDKPVKTEEYVPYEIYFKAADGSGVSQLWLRNKITGTRTPLEAATWDYG